MKPNLLKHAVQLLKTAALALIVCTSVACQSQGTEEEATAAEAPVEATATAVSQPARPAPDFYIVPPELASKRVWICEGTGSDLFHVQHDCPVLLQCKGKGTFRNLVLPRAIETFGRYNCQECSKDLDHIFDEDAVRDIVQ
ncbi:hypothetical protein [Pontibacter mangrovi]|uniref:Rieske domain-containing protein n=1 Tax=Pontibacter mangrovi TaxID=2589816 RepID=A0A501W7P5_9BACT|nr:hypothetical protein [Pontibacter mangrovi]TPE42897.1 hypothetical protein FJM65_16360 [Pontibacter mangrovi]